MSENRDIFRKEYVESRLNTAPGSILIASSINQRIAAYASVLIIIMIVCFLYFGEYTKKAFLEGMVMPSSGLIKIRAPSSGFIEDLVVNEGQTVESGKPLYLINSERFDISGTGVQSALLKSLSQQYQMLESQLDYELKMSSIKIEELNGEVEKLESEIRSAEKSLELAKQKTELKQRTTERYSKLASEKYVSEISYQNELIDLVSLLSDEESFSSRVSSLEKQLQVVNHQKDYWTIQKDVREKELVRQLQALEQQEIELSAIGTTTINAPVSGIISAVVVEQGQAITAGDTVVSIIPDMSDFLVDLYAPSRDIGFITEGQEVGLRFAAFPFEKFGIQKGKVVQISQSALLPSDIELSGQIPKDIGEALYRVTVELEKQTVTAYGREEPLRVGMAVSADIRVEKRHLYEWLLGPIQRIREKVQ
ncbi:HlyD family secretion protein [Enterovibrio coralii]|uniref:Toxin secretion, membrane fusion protein n=1 Tax=Enterovibrio coralii TaxID=294935 RepID=A0A135IA66_9GAMM|nr:HlyD family efflux transporter periplasmic adaptor subunit [Enterovibrio coralii]KXF82288.1 hypothetical protein ATN88_08930 [Enterovibrio coralii]